MKAQSPKEKYSRYLWSISFLLTYYSTTVSAAKIFTNTHKHSLYLDFYATTNTAALSLSVTTSILIYLFEKLDWENVRSSRRRLTKCRSTNFIMMIRINWKTGCRRLSTTTTTLTTTMPKIEDQVSNSQRLLFCKT
jgi:hypothetical protein